MNRTFLQMLIRRAEHVAARPGAEAPGDEQLLARFAREGDEAAFAALVARHGRLVWSVCRGLLARDADAEDAFQATFLALVRGAKSVRSNASLAPWLHVTATRVCKKVRLTAARRNGREHRAAVREATPPPVPEAAWEAASLAVHEEIAALSPTLRTAFVTCVLEGERHHDAAARLGVPVGTLSARVSRARQTLLDRLGARGLAPGVAAAALALGGTAGPAAVPDVLTEAARGLLPGGTTTVTPYLMTLARTATDGVTMKAKMLAAAVLIAGAASFTTGGWVLNRADAQAAAAPPPPPIAVPRSSLPADASAAAPAQSAPRVAGPAPTAYPPTQPGPSATAPASRYDAAPAAAWLYDTVRRPTDREAFTGLLAKKSVDGWEYVGGESLADDDGTIKTYCVFKKPNSNVNMYRYSVPADPFGVPTREVPIPFRSATPPVPTTRPALADDLAPSPVPSSNARPAMAKPAADLAPSGAPSPTPRPTVARPAAAPFDDSLPSPVLAPATRLPRAKPPVEIDVPMADSLSLPAPTQPATAAAPKARFDRVMLRNVAATDAARAVESFVSQKHKDSDATVRLFPDAQSNSVVVQASDATLMNDIKGVLEKMDVPAPTPPTLFPSNMIPPPVPSLKDLYESTAPPTSVVVTVNHVVPSRAAKALQGYLKMKLPNNSAEVTVNADDAKKRIDLKGPNELVKKLANLVRDLDRDTVSANAVAAPPVKP